MSVFIGLVDKHVPKEEPLSWDVNKIGGFANWLNEQPPQNLPVCLMCGGPVYLICQLYCPLFNSKYHRCLYIFVCMETCGKQPRGWRVFRSMKCDETYRLQEDEEQAASSSYHTSNKMADAAKDEWGVATDDWGEESDNWDDDGHVPGEDDFGNSDAGFSRDSISSERSESESDGSVAEGRVGQSSMLNVPESNLTCDNDGMDDSTQSLSQLHLSEGIGNAVESKPPHASNCPESGRLDSGDSVTIGEDACLASEERWNAMSEILNTQQFKDSQTMNVKNPGLSNVSSLPTAIQPFYINVIEEPCDANTSKEEVSDDVLQLIHRYEQAEGKQLELLLAQRPKSKKGHPSSEIYEKSELKHGDKTFHKFLKRLQRCPEQCIRYDRGGDPLLISQADHQPKTGCLYCGRGRVFELQLVPTLIPWLKTPGGNQTNIEFGTVLVYTCKNNCWPPSTKTDHSSCTDLLEEEVVLIQDPDSHLYR